MSEVFHPRGLLEVHLAAFPSPLIQTHDGDPHVSATQLKMFARCPEQYRRRYLLGEKERPGGALAWGIADHACHEENFKQKIVTHQDMTVADIKVAFAAALDLTIEENGGPAEIEWERGVHSTGADADKAAAQVKDYGVELAALYHREVSPTIQPLGVEEMFTLPAEMLGSNVKLVGRLDLRATVPDGSNNAFVPGAEGPGTVERIIERKTSAAKKKAADNPEYVTQARIEQLGGHLVHGTPLDVDFHLSLKPGARRKNPGVVANDPDMLIPSLPEAVVLQQVRRLIAGISSTYAMYGPDEPWPGSWAGFSSPCGYCGYRASCPWWHAEAWA